MLFCFLTSAKGKTEGLFSLSECVLFSSSVSPSPCLPTLFYQPCQILLNLLLEKGVSSFLDHALYTGTEMTNLKQLLPSAGSLVAEIEQEMKQHFNEHSVKKNSIQTPTLFSGMSLSPFCHLSSSFPG